MHCITAKVGASNQTSSVTLGDIPIEFITWCLLFLETGSLVNVDT